MPDSPEEFFESFDDDDRGPLLPPDDRLWRHPSEIGAGDGELVCAREHWLSRTPTRAGAWSAGIVGAVLATGVVLFGTHLTVWLSKSPSPARVTSAIGRPVDPPAKHTVVTDLTERVSAEAHSGLAIVTVTKPRGTDHGDGAILSSSGEVIVPAPLVEGATAIEVTTSDGSVYAGRLVGTDIGSQLAVVAIGVTARTAAVDPLPFSADLSVRQGDWLAIAWSTPDRGGAATDASIAGVRSSAATTASDASYDLLDSLTLQALDLASAPEGAVLVNASGQLVGIVVARHDTDVTIVPGVVAEQVGSELAEYGPLQHGWLGIVGKSTRNQQLTSLVGTTIAYSTTSTSFGRMLPEGVEVVSVEPGTPAAAAGLRVGDVIEAVNGEPVDSLQSLQADLYVLPPYSAVSFTVDRGSTVTIMRAQLEPAA